LIVRRDGEKARLFTRRGYDWTVRYPAIATAAGKIRSQSFTLDGEAVACGEEGVAIFHALHRHGTVRAAILQFELLELKRRGSETGDAQQAQGAPGEAPDSHGAFSRCTGIHSATIRSEDRRRR
jgi:hypothetical protein